MPKKKPEASEIIEKLETYRQQLYENPKISATKFSHMQTALHWAKQIIRDSYGIERTTGDHAWIK